MTDSTWTDATGSHNAKDPQNWSSGIAPQPGDNLFIQGGSTLDIRDNDLKGNPLQLTQGGSGPVILSMTRGAQVDVVDTASHNTVVANIQRHASLSVGVKGSSLGFQPDSAVTVDLADRATLDGTFYLKLTHLDISGGDKAKFINNDDTVLSGTRAVVRVDVAGTGTFRVEATSSAPSPSFQVGSYLEFAGRVSGGQTIDVSGGSNVSSQLVIDQPNEFHATVDLHVASIADLVGLAEADHWSYANDVLSISNVCGKVIDRLHVVSEVGTHGLLLSKTSAGDVLVTPGTDFSGSLASPTS
jgi:hypothetical protein